MKKVSIIVPYYNSQKTLERCIESVLHQTYENFELLLVDDGSDDESVRIADKYSEADCRVKAIHKEHKGVSAARNRGIDETTGEYIQFIDSDDFIEPDMLEKMTKAMERENADIAVCGFAHPCMANYLGDCVLDLTKEAEKLFYYQMTFAVMVPWNKMYRREVVQDKFDEEVHFNEDELFGLANMNHAKKLVGISDILYHYYQAPPIPGEESCITKIVMQKEFWKKKDTFWYKRERLLPKVDKIVKAYIDKEHHDDYMYARSFDLIPWETIIFHSMGVKPVELTQENIQIFREKSFMKTMKVREKYGVKYVKCSAREQEERVARFTYACTFACDDIADRGLALKPYNVCLGIFVRLFIDAVGAENTVDDTDVIAAMYLDLLNENSAEAGYVNNLFEQKYTMGESYAIV